MSVVSNDFPQSWWSSRTSEFSRLFPLRGTISNLLRNGFLGGHLRQCNLIENKKIAPHPLSPMKPKFLAEREYNQNSFYNSSKGHLTSQISKHHRKEQFSTLGPREVPLHTPSSLHAPTKAVSLFHSQLLF